MSPADPALWRCFVAVDLPPEQRRWVAEQQRVWRAELAGWRWVPPAQFHLTLVFLGATDPGRIDLCRAVLEKAVEGHRAFEISLEAPGWFGPSTRPRVLWWGVGQGRAALEALQGDVSRGLSSAGWSLEDRPFRPHLTVGRSRARGGAAPLTEWVGSTTTKALEPFPVDRITLYRSVGTARGVRYSALSEMSLSR